MWYFNLAIILLIGAASFYFIFKIKPKLKQIEQENYEVKLKNERAKEEFQFFQSRIEELKQELEEGIKKSDEMAQQYYDKTMENAKLKYSKDVKQIRSNFQETIQQLNDEYLDILETSGREMNLQLQKQLTELNNLNKEIEEQHSIVTSAIEANKRAFEISHKKDFYRVTIPKEDIEEIEQLRAVVPHLRNPEPLNKVIWKYYYENPTSDMINRVVGDKEVKTGIYKITNLNNGMCYVGQSKNIATRFRQHIKRGLGAEAPTKNKLYPIMASEGIENFSFEIIEECANSQLNDKEDYWQEYFKAKEFGYSIK